MSPSLSPKQHQRAVALRPNRIAEGFSVPPSEVVVCTQVLPTSLVVADGVLLSEPGPQS